MQNHVSTSRPRCALHPFWMTEKQTFQNKKTSFESQIEDPLAELREESSSDVPTWRFDAASSRRRATGLSSLRSAFSVLFAPIGVCSERAGERSAFNDMQTDLAPLTLAALRCRLGILHTVNCFVHMFEIHGLA